MIYLDYNATTPIDKSVADMLYPYLYGNFGNPSSSHEYGIAAKKAVEAAREQVANLLGAKSSEIVFTSGGSESNNMAIKGVAHSLRQKGHHIITTVIEHPSVLNPCRFLEKNGYNITYLPVDGFGIVNPVDVENAITARTILVSIMHANNETGAIQPIKEISRVCREQGVLLHTDAAQTVGKIPTRVKDLDVDLLTVAGHKLYAPKGTGALYIRDGLAIEPLIHGAGHENGRRAGTENVISEVALGQACQLAGEWLGNDSIRDLTERLYKGLKHLFGDRIRLNGHPEKRLPNTLFISFLGFRFENIMKGLGCVAVSTGSACHSGATLISPVLKAMGVSETEVSTSIRFSLGRLTNENEIDIVLDNLSALKSTVGNGIFV